MRSDVPAYLKIQHIAVQYEMIGKQLKTYCYGKTLNIIFLSAAFYECETSSYPYVQPFNALSLSGFYGDASMRSI